MWLSQLEPLDSGPLWGSLPGRQLVRCSRRPSVALRGRRSQLETQIDRAEARKASSGTRVIWTATQQTFPSPLRRLSSVCPAVANGGTDLRVSEGTRRGDSQALSSDLRWRCAARGRAVGRLRGRGASNIRPRRPVRMSWGGSHDSWRREDRRRPRRIARSNEPPSRRNGPRDKGIHDWGDRLPERPIR